jgi:hypothetical protein
LTPVPDSHLFFAGGAASDASGHRFHACLPFPSRQTALHEGQKLAIYLLVTACGVTQIQVAHRYGVTASTVSRAMTDVINHREAMPHFDDSLSSAERLCMSQFNVRL